MIDFEDVCNTVAAGLYANADALAIEAGKYQELAALLVAGDTGATLESLLGGLVQSDPAKWSSVWRDLEHAAAKLAAKVTA